MTGTQLITMDQPAPSRLLVWVSVETMAELFEVSETTIWEWVKHKVIPKPRKFRGVTRWRWSEVEEYLDGGPEQSKVSPEEDEDPILRASRGS